MKKKFLIILTVLALVCMPVSFAAFADSQDTVSVVYNEYEAVIAGEIIEITADVTRNGVTSAEKIRYKNFNYKTANKLFSCFDAVGTIEGYSQEIKQRIVVVPKDVLYFINSGANETNTDYVNGTEGVLGHELDHSGAAGETDGYFNAVLRRFPELSNRTANKQYGESDASYGVWGYTGSAQIANINKSSAPKDIYTAVMFPKRGTLEIEYRLSAQDGEYDLYLGLYNLWFSRNVELQINGAVINAELEIKPSKENLLVPVTVSGGTLSVKLIGKSVFNEPMVSFLCLTQRDSAAYPELNAPSVNPVISLDAQTVDISGLTPGAKLQIFDAQTETVLFEDEITAEDYALDLSLLDNYEFIGLGLVQANARYASEATFSYKTDITDYELSYEEDFVARPLKVFLSARADSGIIRLVINKDGAEYYTRDYTEHDTEFSDSVEMTENGSYEYILHSGANTFMIKKAVIANIDLVNPSFELVINAETGKRSGDGICVKMVYASVSPVKSVEYVLNGEASALASGSEYAVLSKSGKYVFSLKNSLDKKVSKGCFVALSEYDAVTVGVKRSETKKTVKEVEITLDSRNGYSFKSAVAYFVKGDEAEKIIVNSNTFNAYESGVYFVDIENTDGSREILRLAVDNIVKKASDAKNPLGFGAVAGISFGVVLPVCAGAGVALYFVLNKLKKTKGETKINEKSEN